MRAVTADTSQPTVDAGPFGDWLIRFCASLKGTAGTDVPCGDCTGCCTSGYSVQLRPEDQRALTRIPAHLLVSPPGFPRNHRTMAARPNGHCPMLTEHRCSIYQHRPQTCLDYDCRVFAAAGINAGGSDKSVINQRVSQWRFSYLMEADELAHRAIRSAATFIRTQRESFPSGRVPTGPTGIAVLAVKAHAVFLNGGVASKSDAEIAMAILEAGLEFDAAPPLPTLAPARSPDVA
jgi:Fe-S-cluster containining protein